MGHVADVMCVFMCRRVTVRAIENWTVRFLHFDFEAKDGILKRGDCESGVGM